ncbi:MAG: 2-amino-4-hydroxy-6-hydroxymethyldihydropteridine diphosphokinase [Candidatus Marinimicrobia bacterium]|nr:2-amino-4-hydroxy-6-hydroxymethyldihydropteridine diphosphokinase [Candidatus Neomarinimicrobiota bacterium]MCF7850552.1 2-amino-4-hydroxy-6-hydroxymethyldihydropteridine diphosphokinase [Candidatus Neomarinimicrobiota bacterium]MCF7904126.1 2-amino-4-hydroxy-6-hydroxymethyldihydropteridine diphosphokinase [Candidatus Neomarinimicrobiota bacterium]
MRTALISIGSNQNDPQQQVVKAFEALQDMFGSITISSLYETQPVGMNSDAPFINAAAVIQTEMTATDLLDRLLRLERESGRLRDKAAGYQSRPLDLDIILMDDAIIEDGVQIPHPRFRERRFVLEPSAEIASRMTDPVTGQSILELLNTCADPNWVKKIEAALEVI